MKTLVIWMLCSNAVWAHDLKQLLGTWKTVKVVTASPIVGSDPDLDTLAGKYLYVGPKTVRVGRHSCIGPYKPIRESLAEFQEDYKLSQADVRDLNLPDPVSGYRADCIDIFLPKPGIMIFNLEGFFYRAVRVSNITQPEAEKSHNNHAETQPQHSDH